MTWFPFSLPAIAIALNMATVALIVDVALYPANRFFAWISAIILSTALFMLAASFSMYLKQFI